MDAEVLRLQSHLDQTRSEIRAMVLELGRDERVHLIKTCAAGRLSDLDEGMQLMVGMLAVVAIFDLVESAP